ncbi:uncharacterized protein MKK02DRAFT_31951 [Dioszegia hungarica]|uniref:Uncharacterized protein n=1 Tax=Dioszegia hungarica TaxID=4972 RepID=A0AA38HED9_9TREE|nr:uncharacterized protein MKK02DRAFT_31951 [Dioszegia hungarica]KAI9638527.1 hypothetical protein MKK02DRAFT_31951 [Dioszegia hungarica]
MPRPRSLSLSTARPRARSAPLYSPPGAMSIKSLITTDKPIRYSPYYSSRLSFSSSTSSSRSRSSISSEDGCTSGSDISRDHTRSPSQSSERKIGSLALASADTTPIVADLSRLALTKALAPPPPVRTKPATRPGHRRTQSLAAPPSYGFLLHPQTTPTATSFPHRRAPLSPRSITGFRTPSPPVSRVLPARDEAKQAPTPLTPTRKATFDRMMLVNPAIAAHLRRGGAVNMRTPDGAKRWRVRLQREGGKLEGVMEEGEKSPGIMVGAC